MAVNKLARFVERRHDFFEKAADTVFFLLPKLVFERLLLGSRAIGGRESRRYEEADGQSGDHAMVHF